jgi:hypothetical protein
MPRMKTRQRLCSILLPFAGSACIHAGGGGIGVSVPIPSSVVTESPTITHSVPTRAGQLSQQQFDSVAPAIRGLRADPAELSLLVGDTVRVSALVRIVALDSAGAALGEITMYDFGYSGRGFRLLSDGQVTLSRAGTVRFTARLAPRYWRGRDSARPSTQVALIVGDGAR